ncbi:MAG: hypothetical protein ACI8R9_002317 [Paraglaciecola sp.]|jgi:hypothetical protein
MGGFVIAKKWTMPIRNWRAAMTQFMIEFEERLTGHVKIGFSVLVSPLIFASCNNV